MLNLTRKRNESIRIGDDIVVVVLNIKGGKCDIGIDAPKHIPLHRGEVYEAIKRESKNGTVASHAKRHAPDYTLTLEDKLRNIIDDLRCRRFSSQSHITAALEGALVSSR